MATGQLDMDAEPTTVDFYKNDSSLSEADQATQLLLSSGVTVPIEAERVLKPAAMPCATKDFDDDEREGLALLTAMLQKFSISTRAKKPNNMLAEMLRA